MSSTAESAEAHRGRAQRLGISAGTVVAQFGEDSDVDETLVDEVSTACGTPLVGFDTLDTVDVVDVVLLWWRDGDGDLVDALVDARPQLSESGVIWLLTPKAGRNGHVEPADILEAVPTAGLTQTSTISVAPDWAGARLAAPRGQRSARR